jgi:hypothetical protein
MSAICASDGDDNVEELTDVGPRESCLGLKPRRRLISLLSLSSRVSKPAPEDSVPRVCFTCERHPPIDPIPR